MADGTYRFQQPGVGQFYFQAQQHNHHSAHQRHLLRNGTGSPNGRLKFNTDTPSPSRSPPLNQSPSHNSYAMYSQNHQGQPVMMNGQSHQRFGMPMPKFQHPTHHAHHAHQTHHPHSQSTSNLAHQHSFTAATLASTNQHFAPAHLQNGTTANVEDEIEEPMNEHWQLQLQLAAESRQASSPHYYARAVAQQTKGLQLSSNQADQNDNGIEERNRATATKDHRRQDWMALDFGGQGLRSLSGGLFQYIFLDKLYLNHNKLKTLPPNLGRLKNLTHLDISSNELTEIPEEIGMLINLKKLLLFDNHLQTLPFELGYLYQLDTLGIEGNPLADILKSRIMQEGTKSLIKYLKEEMPAQVPPSNRDWLILDETGKNSSSGGNSDNKFTALTYNTLCDRYATNQQYGYAPSRALAWEFRRDLLLNEIRGHDADIVCLQEIDQGSYHGFFREQLAYNDYKGVYWPKGRAQGMPEEEAKLVDGCATFFKGSKYVLLEKNMIHFGQTAVRRPDAKGQDDIYNRLWQKDNIAVVIFLENRITGERLIVVNAHIYWDPAYKDVKLVQVAIMMEEVTQLAEKYTKVPPCTDKAAFRFSEPEDGKQNQGTSTPVEPAPSVQYTSASQIPILVCGDFNSRPGSAVYNLLAHGRMAEEHPDLEKRLYGNLSRVGMSHPFTLKSAYSSIGELKFTNYTPGFTDVIDYIWYSSNSLQVSALLGEVDKEYLKRVPGFPNYHFPSDHLALLAEFAVKSKKNKPVEVDFGPQRDKPI
ncbi:Glucose-repressible alcohol dehydrogenase transcriptional effector [Ophidiomyces ophidiicola]|nr:Glucose-repressible alcohol dehydrogenase transcriptional effector [Ophidiomyces ophidiicola]